MAKAVKTTDADDLVPVAARYMAAIYLLAWCGVIIAGRLITYYRPPYVWCWWC